MREHGPPSPQASTALIPVKRAMVEEEEITLMRNVDRKRGMKKVNSLIRGLRCYVWGKKI